LFLKKTLFLEGESFGAAEAREQDIRGGDEVEGERGGGDGNDEGGLVLWFGHYFLWCGKYNTVLK